MQTLDYHLSDSMMDKVGESSMLIWLADNNIYDQDYGDMLCHI